MVRKECLTVPSGERFSAFGFPRLRGGPLLLAVNTFDRHLLREWLQILGLVLAAMCGLLLLQVLYEDFRALREFGARGSVFWRYLLVTMPSFLNVVLPLALLVSLLYALGKLHRANELTAMRAAGASYTRLTVPIWLVGIACCGLSWWLNTNIVPWSVEESRAMRDDLQFQHESRRGIAADHIGASYSVAFDNQPAGRMWFFNRYSRGAERGYGVTVSEMDDGRREVRRHLAAEARRVPEGGWVFRNGRTLTFSAETGEPTGSLPFAEMRRPDFHEDPELMLLIDRKPSHLSLHELRELIAYLRTEQSPKLVSYAVRYYSLIADTITPLVVIALAIPFAVAGVRVNPAVGVSKSIGLFFLYYAFTTVSTSLASRQILDPLIAAWLPHAAMTSLAVWFFARLR